MYKENRSTSYKKSIEAARKALNSLSFNRLPSRQKDQPANTHPKHVSEYSKEIIFNLKEEEKPFDLTKEFLSFQCEISQHGRSILVNWLVTIHRYLKLVPESLHLAVSLIDRYLNKMSVSKYQVQLLGISCLFLSSKYEEIYPPEFAKFLKVCENVYSKTQVIMMEKEVLKAVDFKLNVPTSFVFFSKFAECANLSRTETFMGQYLLELGLVEVGMCRFRNSVKAASAVYISLKNLRKEYVWKLQAVTGYQESELKECCSELSQALQLSRFNPMKSVREKFSSSEYEKISSFN